MRTNKTILDEAARSVRRTFIGSVAGSVGMLAVVGAAGAYGMPEKLTAQALSLAIAKFGVTAPREPVARQPERKTVVMTVAQNMPSTSASDATPLVMPRPVAAKPQSSGRSEIVRTVPQAPEQAPVVTAPAAAASAPVVVAMPSIAPAPTDPAPVVAASTVAEPAAAAPAAAERPAVATASVAAPSAEAASAFALALPAPTEPTVAELPPVVPVVEPRREPAPTVTASIAPSAPVESAPSAVQQLSAPMVFEPPKPGDVQKLSELPKTEVVVASATPEPVQAQPKPELHFPMPVTVALPLPKPPLTPAQRLDLQGKDYDKAEKCLAQAIYFEARNEPARGQQAVAQVVLNRVFSPYYPKDVCSVVFQNAHRHLACQFTFACDGKPESINERGAWARANRIAKQTLEAKIWLSDVDRATHYHAAYVRPRWVREMKVMARYGLHTFYRPRNWGDGHEEPAWGPGAVKKSVKS